MRVPGVLLGAVLVVLLLKPTAASAAPVTLCEPDPARGAVPEVFAVDACVDGAGVTLHNTLDEPVVVRPVGDLGSAVRVRSLGGGAAVVIRLADGRHDVLMPGDVARWPLGAGSAEVTVTGLYPAMIPAIVEDIRGLLPVPEDDAVSASAYRGIAALVRQVASAVEERTSCREDKNFLRMTACDVTAATRIGQSVAAQLPPRDTAKVAPVVLDRERWDEWATAQAAPVGPRIQRTIRIASVPLAAAPLPPPGGAAPTPPPRPVRLPAPAPVPLSAVPTPSPLPAVPAAVLLPAVPPPSPPAPVVPPPPPPAPVVPPSPPPAPVVPAPPPSPTGPAEEDVVVRDSTGKGHGKGQAHGNGKGHGLGNGGTPPGQRKK